ncbi:MAG: bifunctional riboflavin kinase/FAD synthetase [Acidobacteriota bacterium]
MILLTDLDHVPPLTPPVMVTIGNFDGLHRGHKRVIRKVICRAREEGGTSVVVTFEPHPMKVLYPDRAPALIQTLPQKRDVIAHLGIQALLEVPFTREFGAVSAEAFARLLSERLRPKEIYIGEDFRFGHHRDGDIRLLQTLGSELGFSASAFPKLRVNGEEVSSTRIRHLLIKGEMESAVRLLGRPYVIEGEVERGAGRGRTIGIPTANLAVENELIPALGVYVVAMDVGDPLLLPGVANLGTRPTFGNHREVLEVHLLEGGRDLYGQHVRVLFFKFLRPETRFPSVDALLEAIAKDIQSARHHFKGKALPRRMFY